MDHRPSYLDIGYKEPSVVDFDTRVIKELANEFAKEDGERIKTYLRIRPTNKTINQQQHQVFIAEDDSTLLVRVPVKKDGDGSGGCESRFKYTRVFGTDASQSTVFEECVRGVVDGFFNGENGLIFSYGATNSGKTYTMQGYGNEFGIVPRTLDLLFSRLEDSLYKKGDIKPHPLDGYVYLDPTAKKLIQDIKERVVKSAKIKPHDISSFVDSFVKSSTSNSSVMEHDHPISSSYETVSSESVLPDRDTIYSVWLSFAEIYNEKVYDLFDAIKKGKRRRELKVYQDKQNRVYIKDLTECCVNSAEEAYEFFLAGRQNLQFASTGANSTSSRSHSFFNIRMVGIGRAGNHLYPKDVHSFSFCDLAGLERTSQTGNVGMRLKESGSINQSLLVLLKCIRGLRDKQKGVKHGEIVSFRESKLTRLFQSYLMSASQISMIVNINPDPEMTDSSIQVITNSAIASTIRTFKKMDPPIPILPVPLHDSDEDDDEKYESAGSQSDGEGDGFNFKIPAPPTVKKRPYTASAGGMDYDELALENKKLKRRLETIEEETREEVAKEFDKLLTKQRVYYEGLLENERKHMEYLGQQRLSLLATCMKSGMLNESSGSDGEDIENIDPGNIPPLAKHE